jgi:hypothetical protein
VHFFPQFHSLTHDDRKIYMFFSAHSAKLFNSSWLWCYVMPFRVAFMSYFSHIYKHMYSRI